MPSSATVTVVVDAERDGPLLTLDVSNDSPGIAPGVAEDLFKVRAPSTEGTGIGLYVSRAVMANVGGSIVLHSADPVCFRLKVPLLF